MSTSTEAVEATFEERLRSAIAENMRLAAERDEARWERDRAKDELAARRADLETSAAVTRTLTEERDEARALAAAGDAQIAALQDSLAETARRGLERLREAEAKPGVPREPNIEESVRELIEAGEMVEVEPGRYALTKLGIERTEAQMRAAGVEPSELLATLVPDVEGSVELPVSREPGSQS